MIISRTVAGLLTAVMLLSMFFSSALAQQPNVGGTIVVNLVSEPTVIPGSAAWNSGFVAAQIFDSLLSLGPNLELLPGLATEWRIDTSQRAYVFKLRKEVKWHDGIDFTADDVKFSFEKIISRFHTFGALYFKNTVVEIRGDEVVIKPERFLPGAQLRLFATTETIIYPKHLLEKDADNYMTSAFRTNPVGTGPFKFNGWTKGNFMELVRNQNYWDQGKPYLEKIVIRFLSDPASVLAGLQRGEVHYMFRGIPFEAISSLQENPNLKVYLSTRPPYSAALWINVKSPPLNNVEVRRAIAYAIDRADIAQKATFGISKPDQWMIDPLQVPQSPNLYLYSYNPEIANMILDKAGFPRGPDGYRFTIELMTRTGEPDEQLFAQLIRDQLDQVGIKVNIVSLDFATYLARQQRFEYQIATVKYWIDPLWVYQLFHTEWIGKGAFTNNFQYSNPEVDRLLDQWLVETDKKKQVELLQRVGDILSRELPAIILYEVVWPNVLNKNFEGPNIPVGRYVFFDPLNEIYNIPLQKQTLTQTIVATTPTQIVTRTLMVTTTVIRETVIQQAQDTISTSAIPLIAGLVIGAVATAALTTLRKGPKKQAS
ncbi:MAG: ABC transporter substrate-binding protein [Candidatus Caldarchaeum sp.]|uniref:Solute-binding protein family 5 domain-containing protein n=1 Tax=Caldiarchaeum subterraneum TaxID=311458 RepID=A0A7C5Y8L0_CALS0